MAESGEQQGLIRAPTRATIFSTNPGDPAERRFCMDIMMKLPRIRIMPKPDAAKRFAVA
ncbi:hypothetical protein ACFL2U_02935 [Patescibacteria group bacterium]